MKAIPFIPVIFSLIISCGDVSPWDNFPHKFHSDLTSKHLSMLTEGSSTYEPFKVALTADPQVVVGYLQSCRTAINKRSDIDFSLILGDLTDRSLSREFAWVGDIIRDFHRPVLTVVGNHDGLIYGDDIYKRMFGPLNYSFIYNDVKFIMWNNNTYEWGYPNMEWLEREINSHSRVIIVAHQPPGRVERYEDVNTRWKELYQNSNLIGSVHGHMHNWDYQEIYGKPVLTVARVTDTNWGILEFDASGDVLMHRCQGETCASF